MKFQLLTFFLFLSVMTLKAQTPVYLPLGDSYTICEGLTDTERWPNLLVEQLEKNNLKISLAGNPARTGYTTDDLIKKELPYLDTYKPDIVTLLIGVNDYVRGYDTAHFHSNLNRILTTIQQSLKIPGHIVLITIPDYSVTPTGAYYVDGRDVAEDLKAWNSIIRYEGLKRELPVVDIFPLTQLMKDQADLVCEDGLHPSGKEVALWAGLIYPVMEKIIKTYYQ